MGEMIFSFTDTEKRDRKSLLKFEITQITNTRVSVKFVPNSMSGAVIWAVPDTD